MFVAKFLWVVLSLFMILKAHFVKDKLAWIYNIPEEQVEKLLVKIQNCMHESEAGEDFIENGVEAESCEDKALPLLLPLRRQHIYQKHWIEDPIPGAS